MPPDFAISMGLSGPNVRASGIPWDLRSANGGYGAYRELDYEPVVTQNGDVLRPLLRPRRTRCARRST